MLNGINNSSNGAIAKDERIAEMKKAQNMFFKLLTTQLQCQDIENTVDMNQMTQQIFQMNELQTLIAIDHKLDEMNDNIKASSASNIASNMIGKYALTQGDTIAVNENDSLLPISYIIDSLGEAEAIIKVCDDKGNVVHEAKIDSIIGNKMENLQLQFRDQSGMLSVPEGIYKVTISAYDKKDKKPLRNEIYTTNKIIQSIKDGDFIMNNNERIKLNQVIAIQDSPRPMAGNYNPFATIENKMTISDLIKLQNTSVA